MSETAIQGIMGVTMDKIRAMADAQTIIGQQLNLPDGVVIIPVSKISVGLASGGSDFPSKTPNEKMFGGGGGAGVTITPVAFIVVKNGDVRVMQISKETTAAEKAVGLVPELFDKITALFKKNKPAESEEPTPQI